MNLINLDEAVINALDLFIKKHPPQIDLNKYKFPFVVGSGNAYNTGVFIFDGRPAVFADESDFKEKIASYSQLIKNRMITDAVIISASGEKDAVWETELAKQKGLKTTLLTCSPDSSAAKIADQVFTYRKLPEPYTYNTSTYMGMLISTTTEKPVKIKAFIRALKLPVGFSSHLAYSFVLPDKFLSICPMIDIKKSELFGPHLSLRAFTNGHARHAKFVIPWEKELVISLGEPNRFYGHPQHRWHINLPDFTQSATIMALTYYLIGKIQASKPPYFKQNVGNFCADYGPKAYGKKQIFDVIVPGN